MKKYFKVKWSFRTMPVQWLQYGTAANKQCSSNINNNASNGCDIHISHLLTIYEDITFVY